MFRGVRNEKIYISEVFLVGFYIDKRALSSEDFRGIFPNFQRSVIAQISFKILVKASVFYKWKILQLFSADLSPSTQMSIENLHKYSKG